MDYGEVGESCLGIGLGKQNMNGLMNNFQSQDNFGEIMNQNMQNGFAPSLGLGGTQQQKAKKKLGGKCRI